MEQVNPESVVAVGNVQISAPLLPPVRSAQNAGPVPAGQRPQQRNVADLAQQRNAGHGENRSVPVCGSPHDLEKE